MLCCSLCCFFQQAFPHCSVPEKVKSLDLHHHLLHREHPTRPSREWGVADEGNLECRSCCSGKEAGCVTVVRASRRGSSNISVGIDLEHSSSSAEWWELPACLVLLLVASHLSAGCCQPCYSHFILTNSSSFPKLLQYTPNAHRLAQGEEVELCFVAVSQFNLRACGFLAVPLRFSRECWSFNVIHQIGFLTYLGYCNLELMLLSLSSGWQLKQREMFICLEVSIALYLRNGKRSQKGQPFLVSPYLEVLSFLIAFPSWRNGQIKGTSCDQNPLFVSISSTSCVFSCLFPYSPTS